MLGPARRADGTVGAGRSRHSLPSDLPGWARSGDRCSVRGSMRPVAGRTRPVCDLAAAQDGMCACARSDATPCVRAVTLCCRWQGTALRSSRKVTIRARSANISPGRESSAGRRVRLRPVSERCCTRLVCRGSVGGVVCAVASGFRTLLHTGGAAGVRGGVVCAVASGFRTLLHTGWRNRSGRWRDRGGARSLRLRIAPAPACPGLLAARRQPAPGLLPARSGQMRARCGQRRGPSGPGRTARRRHLALPLGEC